MLKTLTLPILFAIAAFSLDIRAQDSCGVPVGDFEITHVDGSPLASGYSFVLFITDLPNGNRLGQVFRIHLETATVTHLQNEEFILEGGSVGPWSWTNKKGNSGELSVDDDNPGEFINEVQTGPNTGTMRRLTPIS